MSDQKACKCGWTGSVDFLEMVLVDEQKHEYEARCPKCSHEITDNPTPTPMSEDTTSNKQMKVHQASRHNRNLMNVPEFIPYSLLNEEQARSNHGQSLDQLNSRGGIGVGEALDILHRRRWATTKDTQAGVDELNALIHEHVRQEAQDHLDSIPPDTNTTQSAEEKLIEAMCITYCHEFGTLREGPKTVMRTRMRQVLNNDIKPFWSEQLAQAKLPMAFFHQTSDYRCVNRAAEVYGDEVVPQQPYINGAIWMREECCLPYITSLEQENAELKAAMQEFVNTPFLEKFLPSTYNKFKKLLHEK